MKSDRGERLWFYSILIFLSRIPFLFEGYGAEEDAWALRLVAERIATTGTYEVSRLPGHPFQELFYSLIWNAGAPAFNLLTALISTGGIHAFMLLLRKNRIPFPGLAGIAMAFTPIVFIHSTDSMDYMWAISFVMMSALATSHKRFILAGLLLGIACGCRITSGAMLLPLGILTYAHANDGKKWIAVVQFTLSTFLFSTVAFLPVFSNYGTGFFTFYEHFPIPGWLKNAYKGTIGVWGLPGLLALCTAVVVAFISGKQNHEDEEPTSKVLRLFGWACKLTCILYAIAFIRLPLKSAFLIPLVPFLLAWLAMRISSRGFKALTLIQILSSFTFGINLAEEHRGSEVSKHALVFEAGGQSVALDPFAGMVLADRSKRTQRIKYTDQILHSISQTKEKAVLITGWWQAHLLVMQREHRIPESTVVIRHYCSEEELNNWIRKGYTPYYLEDQAGYNDLRFKGEFTKRLARVWPYPVSP